MGGLLPLSEAPASLRAWRQTGWGRGRQRATGRCFLICLGIQEDGVLLPETEHPEGGTVLGHSDKLFRMWWRDMWAIQGPGYK